MKTKMRILSILLALTATVGTARADFLTIDITGPLGSASFNNGGSGPVFGLVNTTGIFGVVGASFTPGIESSLFSTGAIQLTNTSNIAEKITILTTDSNYNDIGVGQLITTLSVSNLSSTDDSVTSFSDIIAGFKNNATGPVTVLAPSGTAVSAPSVFSGSSVTTLTNTTTIDLAPGAQTTFSVTTQIANVPEPSSLLLASSALLGFFGLRRRRA